MNRSKRVSLRAAKSGVRPRTSPVGRDADFLFLLCDVGPDSGLIAAHGDTHVLVPRSAGQHTGVCVCPTPERCEWRSCPSRTHHLRHGILGRNRQQQLHHGLASSAPPQSGLPSAGPNIRNTAPKCCGRCDTTVSFGIQEEHHMIFAFHFRVLQTLVNNVFHFRFPFVCALSGSHVGNQNDSRSCQTLGVPRQSRGFFDDYQALARFRGRFGGRGAGAGRSNCSVGPKRYSTRCRSLVKGWGR